MLGFHVYFFMIKNHDARIALVTRALGITARRSAREP